MLGFGRAQPTSTIQFFECHRKTRLLTYLAAPVRNKRGLEQTDSGEQQEHTQKKKQRPGTSRQFECSFGQTCVQWSPREKGKSASFAVQMNNSEGAATQDLTNEHAISVPLGPKYARLMRAAKKSAVFFHFISIISFCTPERLPSPFLPFLHIPRLCRHEKLQWKLADNGKPASAFDPPPPARDRLQRTRNCQQHEHKELYPI